MKSYFKWVFGLLALIVMAVVFACVNTVTGTGTVMMSGLVLAGFTEEQSKSFNEWMEKQATDIQTKVKSLVEAAKDGELLTELKTLLKGDDKTKGIKEWLTILQKQADDQNVELTKMSKLGGQKADESMTLEEGLKALYKSAEFQAAKAAGFPNGKNVFQIKADTSNITGTINMTQQNLSVKFAPERSLAFIPYINGNVVGAEKNRVMWVEGAYTSNVGYVAEGTGQATADGGTATEKTRGMAKISAKLTLNAEMLEDADYVANAFRMKMQEKALLFTDGEVYSGNGSDGVNPSHIYGIVGHATAYSAVTTGSAGNVEKPNIGDLVDDVVLQAELSEQRGLNKIWMNPKDFNRFKRTKDANGQYLFVKDVNGKYTISGLDVVKTTKVTANTMTVADSAKIQLWWKRNAEFKISQMNGTDFVDDAYTAVMFLRNQLVIEGPDKTAVIHVADIDAALVALTLS